MTKNVNQRQMKNLPYFYFRKYQLHLLNTLCSQSDWHITKVPLQKWLLHLIKNTLLLSVYIM